VFTGIVEEVGSIVSVGAGKMRVGAKLTLKDLQTGGSIAVNGVCVTVTECDERSFAVDVMPETLQKTNLGLLKPTDKVNLERPLKLNGEIGGHLVQGHIDGTGRVAEVTQEGGAVRMRFQVQPELTRYIVPKGFIAVDGTSLTVTEKEGDTFGVSIVGYTREHTILADRKPGDIVNLEVDVIGKYVESLSKASGTNITAEFLREHGFMVN
jgi:riboflavin synthase